MIFNRQFLIVSLKTCSVCLNAAAVLLWKVCQNERALLWGQLVLLLPGLLQQLLPHDGEHRTQQRPTEDLGGFVPRQAVAELGHIAVAQPPAKGGPLTFWISVV